MATLLAYTPVESIEEVSLQSCFLSHSWYLGEVGMMGFMVALDKRRLGREECGGTGLATKPAHSALNALSHFHSTYLLQAFSYLSSLYFCIR